MNVAIFGMDPGGHTGLAWGVFDYKANPEDAFLKKMEPTGSATVEGSEQEQIVEVCRLWREFYRECVRRFIPPENVLFVSEDFVLIPGSHAGGKDGISPVRILWGVIGYRMGQRDLSARTNRKRVQHMPAVSLQLANQASTYATGQRLKDWGLWVRGREHERSAWKHVALRLAVYKKAMEAHEAYAKLK